MAEWKEPYTKVDPITITSVTKIVNLTTRYHPGQGDLVIYLNGNYAVPGVEYQEVTPYSIQFVDNLEADDVVTAHYQKLW